MIKVSHSAESAPNSFFFDRDWQKAVFNVMKNDDSLVLLVVWVVFLTFLGRLRSELC